MLRDLDRSKLSADIEGPAIWKFMAAEKELKCLVEHVMVLGLSVLLKNGLNTPSVDQLPSVAFQKRQTRLSLKRRRRRKKRERNSESQRFEYVNTCTY